MKQHLIISAVCIALGLGSSGLARDNDRDEVHAVFVMTNSARHNEILAYNRSTGDTLEQSGRFDTGGRGSGGTTDPLGSQGSLTLSQDRSLLFAVNAGSGDISVFRVKGDRLKLQDVVPSGGSAPVAIAQWDNLVYVLNVAGNSNVNGFRLNYAGELTPIHKSIRYLSTANSGAASVAFSPDGKFLLVTEKLTNNIDAFLVQSDGTLGQAIVTHDPVPGTFAVTFAPDGTALVVETGPSGGTNASMISSFLVQSGGTLMALNSVPTLGAATCWHVVTPDGRFVYTANSASSSVSGYSITGAGNLSPLAGTVVASLPAGTTDLDVAVSSDGKFLYTLNSGSGTIGIFRINQDGTLTATGAASGVLPGAGFNGIAAF
jgi:6-phosphogluconolactonase (cycloisomerase 2 family)